MPSDSKKKRDAKKKEAAKARDAGKNVTGDTKAQNGSETNGVTSGLTDEEKLVLKLQKDMDINAEYRSCTGVLGVHPKSRDIKIVNFSLTFHGCEILTDTNLGENFSVFDPDVCTDDVDLFF